MYQFMINTILVNKTNYFIWQFHIIKISSGHIYRHRYSLYSIVCPALNRLTHLFPNIKIHLSNESILFKKRNKDARTKEAKLWMNPSNKSLCANYFACHSIMLFLEINMKLLLLKTYLGIFHNKSIKQ